MDYRKMIAALAVAATTTAAMAIESSIVGYQNKGFENAGYSIAGNTFLTVGGTAAAMTLGDITPNADFVSSTIQFMTTGGANAKTTFKGKSVYATYTYWTEADEPANGAGWYLEDDEDTEVNQNSVIIPQGDGFLVSRGSDEADAGLMFSGEVSTSPITKGFNASGYHLVANPCPMDITIGDITPNADFVSSTIQFMTTGGANAKTTFKGKSVYATYTYWTEADEPANGPGWYLEDDEDTEVNQNELVTIPAGAGFLVSRSSDEADATVTLPSAL